MKKLKLIWDFTGPDASETARHHEHHLQEYLENHKMGERLTGYEALDELTALSYMVVSQEEMLKVRDDLKPHRGALYED